MKNNSVAANTDKLLIPKGFAGTVRGALGRYGLLGAAARYLFMITETRQFIKNGGSHSAQRRELVKKFNNVQKNVHCAHSPFQFTLMAEYILGDLPEGAIVECGAFKGGGTAKLSLLAAQMGRKLYVFDSFEGLPIPKADTELVLDGHRDRPGYVFTPGQYAGTLEEVKQNVSEFGCLEVCEFVPGYFCDSMPSFNEKLAFVFMDVDLISSARDCLQYLWPLLQDGGHFFTHEASLMQYMQGILDPVWWQDVLGEYPPMPYGAGTGLSPAAEGIASFQKSSATRPD